MANQLLALALPTRSRARPNRLCVRCHPGPRARNSRIAPAISGAWVSSANCPVLKKRTYAPGLSRLNASAPTGRKNGSFLPQLRFSAAASSATDVSGSGAADAFTPSALSAVMTRAQLDPSTHAPWARTMLTFAAILPPDIVRRHGPSSAQRPHPTGDGLPDLVGRIFLDEMDPPDSHLGLRCKPAGEVENRATSEDPTGLGLEEELGYIARHQPVRIGCYDLSHVGGVALDGDLPGPRQRRPSPLARFGERPSVLRHILVGHFAQDGPWQDFLDEEIVMQDHRLAPLGTQRLQDRTHSELVPVVPVLPPHDRFHIRDTLNGLAVAVSPVKAEGRTPVMNDEGDPLTHIQDLEQGIEVAAVLDEAIRAGATVRQLVGVAHADQVGGDAAAEWLQVWQYVAPEVRRSGIAMQQHDGVAVSHLHIRHLPAEDPPPLLLVRKCPRDHVRCHAKIC